MKKTLFLTLALPLAASISVLNAAAYETGTEQGTQGMFAYLSGDLSLNKDSAVPEDLGFNGAFCVGTHNGAGSLTLGEGTSLNFNNSLFIGGRGYSSAEKSPDSGKDGIVTVGKDAVITVGNGTTSSGGHHVDVGSDDISPATGTLNVEGGTVKAAQFVVGNGVATGIVNVTDGGKLQLSSAGLKDQTQVGLVVGNSGGTGTIHLNNGTMTDTTGKLAYVGYEGEGHVILENDSHWETTAGIYAGAWGASRGSIQVSEDSSITASYLYMNYYVKGANEGTMNLDIGFYLQNSVMDNSGLIETGTDTSYGVVNVDYNAIMENTGTIDTGYLNVGKTSSTNYLYIENGGVVNVKRETAIGSSAANGHIIISGEGSTLNSRSIYLDSAGSSLIVNTDASHTLQKGQVLSDSGIGGTVYVQGSFTNNNSDLDAVTIVTGELHGTGRFDTTTVKGGGQLFVGDAPGLQTYDGDLALQDATATFSVSDLTTPASDTVNGWTSQSHSLIKMVDGGKFSLTEATKFVLEFGGEELLADATPGQEVDFGGFELLLVQGGVGESVAALCDTLLANTSFNFTLNPLESTSPTWETTIKGAYYEVRDNNLYLVAKIVPEPATATLSLLALAALASRRRRR